jgi:uncharacterized BrkB/YihY/UPF0761 family membrane protein
MSYLEILIIIIISIVIILWLQYPENKDDNEEDNIKKIFNRLKIPIITICFIVLIYLLLCNKEIKECVTKVSTGLPDF